MSCMTPFSIRTAKNSNVTTPVPCGRCPACTARRVSSWSFRLMQEEKRSSESHFITLTYDTKTVPITSNGFMSLDKRDIQLFFKRLRKALDGQPSIKYYAVGEYGGKTARPHYHLLLFNCPVGPIQNAWGKGQVHYGTVSGASVGYTLKYMHKPGWKPLHRNDDRVPTFSLMSKRLGENYLTDAMVSWHKDDMCNRMYVVLEGGQKVAMPRYYKDKVYTLAERKAVGMITLREMIKRNDLVISQADDRFFNDQAESHMAAFRRMQFKHSQNEKL